MKERLLTLHPSLVRANLLAGGERELVIILWTTVFALVFGAGFRPLNICVGLLVGLGGHYGLIQAAKADPQWFAIYRRHLHYRTYYPAHSSVRTRFEPRPPAIRR
jgi:type IV secretory pathway TrbD component